MSADATARYFPAPVEMNKSVWAGINRIKDMSGKSTNVGDPQFFSSSSTNDSVFRYPVKHLNDYRMDQHIRLHRP